MADLAIIVPTRGRPQNIIKVIQAWDDTAAWQDAKLILAVDADDPKLPEYQEPGISDRCWVNVMPHWMPMVHKLDQVACQLVRDYFALGFPGNFAIGFAGDDHLPRTSHWPVRYLEALREMGTGVVYGDDGYQGEKLCTEWAMTCDIVRALGRMVPAPVEHMYSDVSLLELGQAAGCIRHLPDVKIEHVHPYAGKTEMDAQYKRVNSRQQFARDKAVYQRWQRRERAEQVRMVRELMPADRRTTTAGLQPGGKIVTRPSTRRADRGASAVTNLNLPRKYRRIRGATPEDIMVALADLASQVPADRAIVELGVFQGKTAIVMAWGASRGAGAHVWGIDAWDLPGNTYGPPFTDPGSRNWANYNVRAQGMGRAITLVHGFSLEQAEKWDGPEIGLLFVDDDHSAEMVHRNIQQWGQHLADDAVIAFDDYGHPDWPGVKQAVDEMVAAGVLEPVQVYHDALAVTRLGRERIEQDRRDRAMQAQVVRGEWVKDPDSNPIDLLPEPGHGAGELAATESSVLQPFPRQPEPNAFTEHELSALRGPATMDTTGPASTTEPAGKTEPVNLDPPPAPVGEPEPAGKTEPVDVDPDPDVAVARETVLAGEIPSVPTQTTLDQLNVAQLRELAGARHITLGRDRKTRDAALAALRAGR